MIMGLDEGIQNITNAAKDILGDNTIIYVLSDNGGSTWFGGLNTPLRGSKSTPYEGGVKVPGFLLDLTPEKEYIGMSNVGTEYYGMMHSADVLPTLLGYAGISNVSENVPYIDGYNMVNSIKNNISTPRIEMLLEMYDSDDFIFHSEYVYAYRIGDMKLIEGIVRDPHWYYESFTDHIKSSDNTFISLFGEYLLRSLEYFFSAGPFDNLRLVITHTIIHQLLLKPQQTGKENILRLYNITEDPMEINNIAMDNMDIVNHIKSKINYIKNNKKEKPQKFWMQYDIHNEWPKTFVTGDCSKNKEVKANDCHFTHPWLPDNIDPWRDLDKLTDGLLYVKKRERNIIITLTSATVVLFMTLYLVFTYISRLFKNEKVHKD